MRAFSLAAQGEEAVVEVRRGFKAVGRHQAEVDEGLQREAASSEVHSEL